MQIAPRSSTKTGEIWIARKDSARRIKHAANPEIAHYMGPSSSQQLAP